MAAKKPDIKLQPTVNVGTMDALQTGCVHINNMRKYILLVLFIFSWPTLSADIHGQVYALDGMNVNQFMNTTGDDQQSPEHRS